MEAHVVQVGLPEYRREVFMTLDTEGQKTYVKVFTHHGDGVYLWCSPAEAEELGLHLIAMAQTLKARGAIKRGAES